MSIDKIGVKEHALRRKVYETDPASGLKRLVVKVDKFMAAQPYIDGDDLKQIAGMVKQSDWKPFGNGHKQVVVEGRRFIATNDDLDAVYAKPKKADGFKQSNN